MQKLLKLPPLGWGECFFQPPKELVFPPFVKCSHLTLKGFAKEKGGLRGEKTAARGRAAECGGQAMEPKPVLTGRKQGKRAKESL